MIGDCSVELRLAITTHAQDASETDHFSLEIFRFFLEAVVRHRISPDYTDDLLRKVRRPLIDWRRQMRGNRRASGSPPSTTRKAGSQPECRARGGYSGKSRFSSHRMASRKRFLK